MEKKWEAMSPDEKQEAQFQKLLTPKDPQGNDLKFQGPEAEAAYKASITRIKDAVQLRKTPDRVPVTLLPSMFPFTNAGMTVQEAMYDYDKCAAALTSSSRNSTGPPLKQSWWASLSGDAYHSLRLRGIGARV